MKGNTHRAIGLACSIPIAIHLGLLSMIGLIGSTFPDIDQKIGLKHRKITHNIFALIILTSLVMYIYMPIGIIFGICYLSHLLLDVITIKGIPIFYPFNKKYYSLKLCKSNSSIANGICCVIALLLILYYLKILK